MNAPVLWAVITAGLGVVVVRRRTAAIVLIAAQSMILGSQALSQSSSRAPELVVAGVVLVAKGICLPTLLLAATRSTRESTALASDRHPLVRLAVALTPVLAITLLMPSFGLMSRSVQDTAVALLALGIATAAVRRAAVFQALGFLLAENGIYVAGLGAHGGLPPLIELGLVFDLVVIVTVAAAFGSRIHQELGTADTQLLGSLRD
jgi:hydrogenase-4 component E